MLVTNALNVCVRARACIHLSANAGWLVHGCPLATKPLQSVVADPNQPMSPVVRCCDYAGVCKLKYSDTGYCFIRNRTGRPSLFNYHAAATVCANDRKRLCTKEELFSVKATGCCKQGCDNPHELIWTSSGNCHQYICCCRNAFANFFHLSPSLTPQPCCFMTLIFAP